MEIDALYFEVIHNLVFEMTRLGIDTKNAKMRVESIASRLEFNERRARALESVVAYRQAADSDGDRRDEPAAHRRRVGKNAAFAARATQEPLDAAAHAACRAARSRSRRRAPCRFERRATSVGEQPGPGSQSATGPQGAETPGPAQPPAAAAAWPPGRRVGRGWR